MSRGSSARRDRRGAASVPPIPVRAARHAGRTGHEAGRRAGAGASTSPVSRAICDASQPPPSAFTNPTDDTIRCPSICTSFCSAVNAVVCAVSTLR